jgi:hypothetical protein
MGLFSKKPAAPATTSEAVTYKKAMEHIGAKGSVRDDDITWDMRMAKSQLPKEGYFIGQIQRKSKHIAVIVGGRMIGTLNPESEKTANIALLQHGGKTANCMITPSTSKGDIVRVAKKNGGVVNL